MTAPMSTALPYGIRDCKLTKYADNAGTSLGDTSIDLPYMQTFSFSETEEFSELRGDDRIVTTRGQGAQVEWELESGGISLQAWSVLTGGEIIEGGISPNRRVTMRKFSTTARPYFRMEGQAISDSGGDIHGIVYRCRANDTIEGEFADGEFFVTSASGLGLPLLDQDFDLLYDWIQNEQAVSIPLSPVPNPSGVGQVEGLAVSAPTGTSPTISVDLTWTAVTDADSYQIQRRMGSDAFADGTPATSASTSSTQTDLSTGTWEFRVRAVTATGETGPWSEPVSVTV